MITFLSHLFPSPRFVRFYLMASVGLFVSRVLHRFLWIRLVRDTGLPPVWQRRFGWVGCALTLLLPVSLMLAHNLVFAPLVWGLYVWMGLLFFLVLLLLPCELFRWISVLFRGQGAVPNVERRQFVSRLLGVGVGLTALGLSGIGIRTALAPVVLKRVHVRLPRLPRALSGYTVVQISDVHIGPMLGFDFLEEVVDKANGLTPDLLVITGDLVDGSVAQLASRVAPLARLRARDGVYFVTGNHEYYSGADAWLAHLRTLGIHVLRNEHVSLQGARGFDLGGVDDWNASFFEPHHGMDLDKVVKDRDPSRPLVLLAHQPRAIVKAAQAGVDLQLSGHTHGGQLMPLDRLVRFQQRYVKGLHQHSATTQIYVSSGTGYWGPPMRLGTEAEITYLVLEGLA